MGNRPDSSEIEVLSPFLTALPVIGVNPSGNVCLWTTAAEKLYGWKSHEVIGRPDPSRVSIDLARRDIDTGIDGTWERRATKCGSRLDVCVVRMTSERGGSVELHCSKRPPRAGTMERSALEPANHNVADIVAAAVADAWKSLPAGTSLLAAGVEPGLQLRGKKASLRRALAQMFARVLQACIEPPSEIAVCARLAQHVPQDAAVGADLHGELPSGPALHLSVVRKHAPSRRFDPPPRDTAKPAPATLSPAISADVALASKQGGALIVVPPSNHQSRVELWLPHATQQRADATAATKRVLVVDDHASGRRLAKIMFKRLGYEQVDASDGKQALTILESADQDFALLLVDLQMPGIDGLEVARRARRSHPNLPTIIMTGVESTHAEQTSSKGELILRKPFDVGDLRAAITAAERKTSRPSQ